MMLNKPEALTIGQKTLINMLEGKGVVPSGVSEILSRYSPGSLVLAYEAVLGVTPEHERILYGPFFSEAAAEKAVADLSAGYPYFERCQREEELIGKPGKYAIVPRTVIVG